MDNTISRRAAIDAIRAFYDEYIVYDNGKSIEDLISELPSSPQWIPVSSGELPEKNTHVLVTDWGFVQEAYRSDDRRWYDLDGNKLKGVTAYMPLPKPWEGGENA